MVSADAQVDAKKQAEARRRLRQHAAQPIAGGGYFNGLLQLLKELTAPIAAAIWTLDAQGVLSKAAEVAAPDVARPQSKSQALERLTQAIEAISKSCPQIIPAPIRSREGAASAVTILIPFSDGARACGVIEASFAASSLELNNMETVMAILKDFAAEAGRFSRRPEPVRAPVPAAAPAPAAQPTGKAAASIQTLNRVALELHRDLDVGHVSLTAANEGRLLLGCDRLSVVGSRANRTQVLAVSGQDRVVTRSTAIRALKELAERLIHAEKPFVFNGDYSLLPANLREVLVDYVGASGVRRIEAFPLRVQRPVNDDAGSAPTCETIGVLLAERFQDNAAAIVPADAEALAKHVALALANAQEHQRGATPWRRASRYFFAASEKQTLRRSATKAVLAIAAIILLGWVPVAHSVSAPGKLMPVHREQIFAPTDGVVAEIPVTSNQRVKKGELLLRLHNDRLAGELLAARHALDEKQKLLATLEAQAAVTKDGRDKSESIHVSGAISKARIEITGIGDQLLMLQREAASLEVRAPRAGTVTTFDPKQLLLNRPVRQGETLLEVMDTSGPWQLRLDMPTSQVGHVLSARKSAPGRATPVSFTLATQPEDVFTGALRTIAGRAFIRPDAASVVPMEVDFAVESIPNPVAGAEILARVHCGQQPLWFVMFGDAVTFVRARLW
jgi:hypothetical protein